MLTTNKQIASVINQNMQYATTIDRLQPPTSHSPFEFQFNHFSKGHITAQRTLKQVVRGQESAG